MSTLKADTVTTKSDDTDLTITGGGTGVPNLEAGFKVGGSAGVPTASIQDDAVTLAKLAAGTDGELITWDASGDPAAVAVGTATHVLTSNGAGAAPTFQAAAGGGTVLISSITASSVASVDFDSALSSTYKGYVLQAFGVAPATDQQMIWLRFSSDGGSSWDSGASDYSWSSIFQSPGSGAHGHKFDFADNQIPVTGFSVDLQGPSNHSAANSCFTCYISYPSDTSMYTTVNIQCCTNGSLGEYGISQVSGGRLDAGAMDSVQIIMESGNVDRGVFNLYGLSS
jgi:hypothetical protein